MPRLTDRHGFTHPLPNASAAFGVRLAAGYPVKNGKPETDQEAQRSKNID